MIVYFDLNRGYVCDECAEDLGLEDLPEAENEDAKCILCTGTEKCLTSKNDSIIKPTEEEIIAILWEIAQQVATEDTVYSDDFEDDYCVFCHGDQSYGDANRFKLEPVCIVIKARALLEQKEWV